METHDLDYATTSLPELVARAIAGEAVVITRDGKPLAELRAIKPALLSAPPPISAADLDWLAERRAGRGSKPLEDAGALVSRMRDEGEK